MTVLSNYEIRALSALLEAEASGADLTGHNGPRVALEALVNLGHVDELRLFEAQRSLGIFTQKAINVLRLNVSGQAAIPWKAAMELTLTKAKELQEAGLLNEEGPPPSPQESTRAILSARAEV